MHRRSDRDLRVPVPPRLHDGSSPFDVKLMRDVLAQNSPGLAVTAAPVYGYHTMATNWCRVGSRRPGGVILRHWRPGAGSSRSGRKPQHDAAGRRTRCGRLPCSTFSPEPIRPSTATEPPESGENTPNERTRIESAKRVGGAMPYQRNDWGRIVSSSASTPLPWPLTGGADAAARRRHPRLRSGHTTAGCYD